MSHTPGEELAFTLAAVIIVATLSVCFAFAALWAFVTLTGAAIAVTLTNSVALLVLVAFTRFSLHGLFQGPSDAQKQMAANIVLRMPKDGE